MQYPQTATPLSLSMPYPHNHRRRLGWTEFVTLVAHWISLLDFKHRKNTSAMVFGMGGSGF